VSPPSIADLPDRRAQTRCPTRATPELDRLPHHLMPAPPVSGPEARFRRVERRTSPRIWDPAAHTSDRQNVMWLAFADAAHRRTWVKLGRRAAACCLPSSVPAALDNTPETLDSRNSSTASTTPARQFRAWWSHAYEGVSPSPPHHPPPSRRRHHQARRQSSCELALTPRSPWLSTLPSRPVDGRN